MSISALNPAFASFAKTPMTNAQRGSAASFEDRLRTAPEDEKTQRARKAAQAFVGVVFIEPILAALRETSQATGAFAPGDAERRFGPLLDQHLAERITSNPNFPLVDSLEKHFLDMSNGPADDPHHAINGELDVVG